MALEDELSCPVCTELFSDPVLLGCGHSFCRRCINDHWTSSKSRNCPVCRTVSPHEPVSNLCLRNTCETYLKEKNNKKEKDEEPECPIHGEKIKLFCQTDKQTICTMCWEYEHRLHKTQPVEQAVRQRKGKLKTAIRPAENMLLSLRNGAAQDAKISKYNQNYDSIMNRAKKTLPDSELSPDALIDVQKHLGNLKYQVWEKMKDICPYYPVILNQNAAPPDVSMSNDLTSVTSCIHRQNEHNPLPLHSNHLVLGSVGYNSGVQTWDIEVGNSHQWSLGVCLGSEESNSRRKRQISISRTQWCVYDK
ncbi:tripartite motif-containing 35-like protein [Labeo rohita]|uniref:Tripartite motif-containing 35-like protein n=1 Tax=Labeo rohita TaxID=84645 RepID=A0A498LS18_LABRO|nr:tripartite motif-containing 35-like protein [Labeo rohita]